jgi:hypothetical protein
MAEDKANPGLLRPMPAPERENDPFPKLLRKAIEDSMGTKKWRLQFTIGPKSDGDADPPIANGVVRLKDNFPDRMREFIKEKVKLDDWCLEMRLLDGLGSDAAGDDDGSVPWIGTGPQGLTNSSGSVASGMKSVKRRGSKSVKRATSRPKAKRAVTKTKTAKRSALRVKEKSGQSTSKKPGRR